MFQKEAWQEILERLKRVSIDYRCLLDRNFQSQKLAIRHALRPQTAAEDMDSEEDIINDSVTLILRLMNTQKVKVEDD